MHIPRPEPLRVGARWGGYRLLELLCQDEQEATFRAEAEGGEVVTLVQLLDAADPGVQARVRREAERARALRHPHALGVVEVEVAGGQPCLRCEAASGRRLQAGLAELGRGERLARLGEVSRALAAAHAQGIPHLDLHLGRLWLDPAGGAQVSGWGLGWLWDRDRVGQRVPPRHAAPEQLLGQQAEIGPASDVWALGVLLFRLLTDRQPFDALERDELIEQIAARPAPSPRARDASVPRPLARLCARALATSPRRRYPDAGAFAADLERALAGQRVGGAWPSARAALLVGLAPLVAWGAVQLAPGLGGPPRDEGSPGGRPAGAGSPSSALATPAPVGTLERAAGQLRADQAEAALAGLAGVPQPERDARWRSLKGQAYLLLGDSSSASSLLGPNAVALARVEAARTDLLTSAAVSGTREQLLEGTPDWLAAVERLLPQRGVLSTFPEAGAALGDRLLTSCAQVLCELHEEAVTLGEVERALAAAPAEPRFALVGVLWKLRLAGRGPARAALAALPDAELSERFLSLREALGRALSPSPVSEPELQAAPLGTWTRQERWLYHHLRRGAHRRARGALVERLESQGELDAEARALLRALSAHAEAALTFNAGFPDPPERWETVYAAAEARIARGAAQDALRLFPGGVRVGGFRGRRGKLDPRLRILELEALYQQGQPLGRGDLTSLAGATSWADPVSLQAVLAAQAGELDRAQQLLRQAAQRGPLLFWRGASATRREIAGQPVLDALRR